MRFLLAAVLGALPALLAADRAPVHFNIPLWEPGKVPLAKGDGPLDAPLLTVFLPPPGKGNGSSVVVAPGGANIMLMYNVEGVDIAERYNDWGAAAFILTYRLSPRYDDEARALDGSRAVQLVRARAKEWGLDPAKIGFAGFSAGSSLARLVAAKALPADPAAADPVSRVSGRPDYLVMVYSGGRATPGEDLKKFPPTYLLTAAWDRGAARGTLDLFQQMQAAGTVAELHVFQKGRHGFGAGNGSPEYSLWMDTLRHFLVQGGFLPKGNR